MTKVQLIEKLSEQVPTLTKRQAEVVVNTVFNGIRTALAKGDKIEIRGCADESCRSLESRSCPLWPGPFGSR